MTDKSEWQGRTGDAWAAEWQRTDRSFTLLTDHLLQRTREFSFRNVLDIGCGAGELSMAIARGRRQVDVTGIDISESLLSVAKERASNLQNVDFVHGDAAHWQAPQDHRADLLISRHGVMFFDNPVQAFTNLANQTSHSGNLLFSSFRTVEENPVFTEVLRLLPQPPEPSPPDAPGPFGLATQERILPILQEAGWSEIAFEPFDFPMITGTGSDAVQQTVEYYSRIGPAARIAAEMEDAARDRFLRRVRELAERQCRDGIVALPAGAWVVSARKAN